MRRARGIRVLLSVAAATWCGTTALTAEEADAPEQATVGGKYSTLIRVVAMPEAERKYGKFHDFGFWKGGQWGKRANLPAGYWVYIAPNWYVWKNSQAEGVVPPRVVSVKPDVGATDVGPGLKEISVTFDRPMATERGWSWMMLRAHGTYPGFRGGPAPQFDETGKTCTLTVSLKEGVLYAVGINSPRNMGFRDELGIPALDFGWAFATGGTTAENMPPRVVSSNPESGAEDVDPALKEISVTFDKPMQPGTWSWVLQPKRGAFPGTRTGKPQYAEDGITCKLPVALKPDTVYSVAINSYRNLGFKGKNGKPALPYGFAFKTAK